jgi:hypothetical protein
MMLFAPRATATKQQQLRGNGEVAKRPARLFACVPRAENDQQATIYRRHYGQLAKMFMAIRAGNVLNWTTSLAAAFLVGFAVYLWNFEPPPNNVFDGLMFLIVAVLYWLLGLAFRYALATRRHDMR